MRGLDMQELGAIKLGGVLIKVIAAIVGGILALVLSGDIDQDGKIKINMGVIIKFASAVVISLFGGEFVIEWYSMGNMSHVAQGFVMFLMAVFGLLFIGILYQSFAMLKGKPLSEVVADVVGAFTAIFAKKQP